MPKILVTRPYFPLDALHVSDYISPSSGATFISCTSHLIYAGTSGCCVAIATQQPEVWCLHIPNAMYVVGSKIFRPDIQKPRQIENAVRDI